MYKKVCIVFSCFFLFLHLAYAHGNSQIGKIKFPTSGSKVAQPYFEKGVAWLHSFEYREARAYFKQARNIDRDFALAYWGEAMTYNHPLWGEQELGAANKILKALAPTAADRVRKAKTPKEKGLIHAINLLYGKGEKKTRDENYAEAMCQLYRRYPADDEIASFYALALLGVTEGKRDFRTYMQAAGIAEEIYGRNPLHPGAMHYVIHSYDDPIHAPLGLRAARSYAKIAPDASHALHMPSHIFLALGLWDDVIVSNKAAWEAGVKQNKFSNPNDYTIDDLHALEWLSYGYLQKEQYPMAYQATKTMEKIAEGSGTPMAKWYYALMRAAYIIESGDYKADLKSLDMTNIELSATAADLYTNALIALASKKGKAGIEAANAELEKLTQSIPEHNPRQDTYENYFTSITQSGLIAAKIMVLELQSIIKMREDKITEAKKLLRRAAALENGVSFGYGPPIPVKPSYELLAALYLKTGEYNAAYREAMVGLKRMPNRIQAKELVNMAADKLKAAKLPIPEKIRPYFNKLLVPDFYQ